MKRHGLSKSRIYRIWNGIKRRVRGTGTVSDRYYKDKGIKMSKRWEVFEKFYRDMNESYEAHVKKFGEKQTSIDRIDSNGDYKKSNCRWATPKQQAENSSNFRQRKCSLCDNPHRSMGLCIAHYMRKWSGEYIKENGYRKQWPKKYKIKCRWCGVLFNPRFETSKACSLKCASMGNQRGVKKVSIIKSK